jgi:plastocyanin
MADVPIQSSAPPHHNQHKEKIMTSNAAKLALIVACLTLAVVTLAAAPEKTSTSAEIVALDECDPLTFNAALGNDFCKNVALAPLGFATTLQDLFAKAAAGTADPGWDFEPDTLKVKEGGTLFVSDQGGEPHTFTEVKQFGGGFIEGLNAGDKVVPECVGGFSRVDVAKTRIIQGSQTQVTGLSKGIHHFQCCIHPWMRVTVEVK